jgi:hypothetical protein
MIEIYKIPDGSNSNVAKPKTLEDPGGPMGPVEPVVPKLLFLLFRYMSAF